MKLDFGCGKKCPKGTVGMDIFPFKAQSSDYSDVSVIGDITKGLPFKNESFTDVRSYHVLEHVDLKYYSNIWKELARVLVPGGRLVTCVPYWTHDSAIITGHRSFHNEMFYERSLESGELGKYFTLIRFEYKYTDEFVEKSEPEKIFARKHYLNSVETLVIKLKRKPILK